MNKVKHYILGYSLVLLLNAGMLAFICPQLKDTAAIDKSKSTFKTEQSEEKLSSVLFNE